jgi:hypothetical protein
MTSDLWGGANASSDTDGWLHRMSRIRIAVATALVAATVFAGGLGHHNSAAPTASHAQALATVPIKAGPVLCCF